MAQKSHPKRGSRGYWPRKRIKSLRPHFNAWPEVGADKAPRLQGFAGYKAGMTHAIVRDSNKNSTTADQEVQEPVTVLEVPPMRVAAIRFYAGSSYGLKTMTEIWADKLDKHMGRLLTLSPDKFGKGGDDKAEKAEKPEKAEEGKEGKKKKGEKKPEEALSKDIAARMSKLDISAVEEVRVLVHTLPHLMTGVPKKVPDMMEIRVGGGTIQQRIDYAQGILGKEIKIDQFAEDGMMVDVAGVTKGFGFAGTIKKWHPKLLTHKNSKHRRMIGTLGPHFPSYVQRTVPQAGQFGTHQRTEFNKRIIKMGDKGEDVTPAGGFTGYGVVRNGYVLIKGSVPGSSKRLIKLRDAVRNQKPVVDKTEILYISKESKQGA